jgi:hypothetical protein
MKNGWSATGHRELNLVSVLGFRQLDRNHQHHREFGSGQSGVNRRTQDLSASRRAALIS